MSRLVNKYVKKCVEWTKEEKSRTKKALIWITVILGGILFVLSVILLGKFFDFVFGFPKLIIEPFNFIISGILIILGYPLALWTLIAQHRIAKGTPMPHIPTQKLIVTGPFKYCRNPMSLGTILFLAGFAVLFNSLFALIIFLALSAILLVIIKVFEEKELEERFGQEYVEYKKHTPFLIPRLR